MCLHVVRTIRSDFLLKVDFDFEETEENNKMEKAGLPFKAFSRHDSSTLFKEVDASEVRLDQVGSSSSIRSWWESTQENQQVPRQASHQLYQELRPT